MRHVQWPLVAIILALTIAGGFWAWIGTTLMEDLEHRNDQLTHAHDIRVSKAKCTIYGIVVRSACDIEDAAWRTVLTSSFRASASA